MISRYNRDNKDIFYTDYDIKLMDEKHYRYLNYAPYYVIENAINKEQLSALNNILSKYDSSASRGTVIGSTAQESIQNNYRNSDVFFVRNGMDSAFEEYSNIILNVAEKVNENVFGLDITSTMDPQYTIYKEGMYFDWHPDGPMGVMDSRGLNCIPKHLQWRKLSCVVSLTQESEYQGGDFQIIAPSSGPKDCVHTIRMDAGSMIFFPSYSAHRVSPVTSGTRKTLVYWLCGPRWR